jgi:hypothetical protein
MTPIDIQQSTIKHAVMAQIHRWYQIYENPQTSIDNQIDILSPDIKLKSGLGEGVGHEAYRQRIAQLPTTWKNAHFIREAEVKIDADGTIALDVALTYLNQGMKPDGSVRTAELRYDARLQPTATVLPRFTAIEIKQLSEGTAPAFEEAYPQNRLKSLLHYWLALIEDPARRVEPFKQLLADGFELQFLSGTITDMAAFEAWLRGPGSAVTASTHAISGFSVEPTVADAYRMQVDLAWQGLLPDGKPMAAKTRHVWTVIDNPKERFARIKTIAVQVLAPLQPLQPQP